MILVSGDTLTGWLSFTDTCLSTLSMTLSEMCSIRTVELEYHFAKFVERKREEAKRQKKANNK